PGGGTSVLPRALGLSRDPVRAARQVAEALAGNRTRRISLGRVNGRRFAFAAGVGLPAEVVRRVDALGRRGDGRRPGDLAFAWAIVRALAERGGRLEPQLEIEGHGAAICAFVANGRPYTYANRVPLPIAQDAELEQGLDLVAPTHVRRRSLVPTIARVLSGRVGGARFLSEHDLDRIEIRCDVPLPLHVDGEDLAAVALVSASGAATTKAQKVTRIDVSTRAAVVHYLRSIHVSAKGAVIQRGALNYAGARCPGTRWTCASTRHTVVQIAKRGGQNR